MLPTNGMQSVNFMGGLPEGKIGIFVAAVIAGFFWLRKWLSQDTVDRLGNSASASVIKMLRSQLDREREHNIELSRALDESNRQIELLRMQVATLTDEVQKLQSEIESLRGSQ